MWRQLAAAFVLAAVAPLTVEPGVGVVVRTRITGAANTAFCNFALGLATNAGDEDGLTRYVALKDQHLFTQVLRSADGPSPSDHPGNAVIVDVATNRTTRIDFVKHEYREQTLSQVRAQIRQFRGGAKSFGDMSGLLEPSPEPELPAQSESRGKKLTFEASVRLSGETRVVAGQAARGVDVSVTAHDPGKELDADGGWVATGRVWLVPHKPNVDALQQAQRAYAKATAQGTFAGVFTDTELPGAETFDGCMPEQVYVGARLIQEIDTLDGTVVGVSASYDIERSSKDYQRAAALYELLVKRATAFSGTLGPVPAKRTRVLDMSWEYVEISDHVDESVLAIPAGFKKK